MVLKTITVAASAAALAAPLTTAATGSAAASASAPGHSVLVRHVTGRATGGRLSHVVVSGDTLSGIAASAGISLTTVEAANSWIANPDLIYPGQRIALSGHAAPPAPAPLTGSYGHPYYCGDGDGDGWDMPCSQLYHSAPAAPAPAAATGQISDPPRSSAGSSDPPPAQAATGSYSAGAPGSFQQCVISRESGGNASAVNPSSGAGGLYGFLPSTWQSLGFSGLPENASVAEQNQAFAQEYARAGSAPWAPYDGC